jgi:hypothetical protein
MFACQQVIPGTVKPTQKLLASMVVSLLQSLMCHVKRLEMMMLGGLALIVRITETQWILA